MYQYKSLDRGAGGVSGDGLPPIGKTTLTEALGPGDSSPDRSRASSEQPADEAIGELTADRVGQEVYDPPGVAFPVRSPEMSRQALTGLGGRVADLFGRAGSGGATASVGAPSGGPDASGGAVSGDADVSGDAVSGGPDASGGAHGEQAPAADPAGAGGGPADGGPGSGGAAASGGAADAGSVQQAQSEAREAAAAAEAESAAFQAQVAERRAKFDAEQRDTALAQLQTMSPAEKRSTLTELGYDPKKVGQLKDAELDGLIAGKLDAEQQKAKILGMTPEELAALSPAQKAQFLVDRGVDRGDLDKAGPGKTAKLFDDVIKAAHTPGSHKVKIQIKGGLFGKSWVLDVTCDSDGGVDIQARKEGGFFSKLLGWVKAALPLVLTVLAPITGGASLIALSVYQAVNAIRSGNWLGAVVGVAGALAGVGTLAAVKNGIGGLAQSLGKVAAIADKVQRSAQAAQAALAAARAKNPAGLLAALAQGAATFTGAAGTAAGKFGQTMRQWSARLQKWSAIAAGGQQVVQAIKHGDLIHALGGALSTASLAIGAGSKTGKDLQRAAGLTRFVEAGREALASDPPNYTAVADAALGLAAQLTGDRRVADAGKLVSAAERLKTAWANRAKNPGGVADAALGLAQAIQLAKYDLDHKETKDAAGAPAADAARAKIEASYQRASKVVRLAGGVLTAATAKPHPDYLAALDGVAQLAAEFTADKRVDAAALITARGEALRRAVKSGNQQQILEAGRALGQAIDGLRKEIEGAHDKARGDAQAQLPPGEHLPDDGAGKLPPLPAGAIFDASGPGGHAPSPSSGNSGGERVHGPHADDDPVPTPQPAPAPPPMPGASPSPSPTPSPAPSPSPTPTTSPAPGGPAQQPHDARTPSGGAWCAQYPTGTTIGELTDAGFQSSVQAFHDAMVAAATPANHLAISIEATFRPLQRAHLMHYAWNVHNGSVTPEAANTASAAAGIAINWDRGTAAASRAAAGEMVSGYRIVHEPSLTSRHTEGKAIDWDITWTGSLMIAKQGETTRLDCTGNGASSPNLHDVGASYGVTKLTSDPPHWSTDGR